MKVRELIKELEHLPPSTDVHVFHFVPTDDGDTDNEEREISHITVESNGVRLWLGGFL